MQKHSKRNSQSLSENNDNESQEDDKVESVHTEPLNKQPKLTLFKQNLFNDAKISDIEQQKETEKEQYIINKRSKTILHDQSNNKSIIVGNDMLHTLKSLLTCSVCLEIKDQINQCPNGHLICSQCSIQLQQQSTQINLSKCPSCRINLQYMLCRCLLAEQMIAELPYQCPSCYDVIPRRLIKLHEYKLCPNRYVLCRYNLVGCLWKDGNQNLCLGEPINVQMRFEHGNEDGQSQLYQSLYSDNSIMNESGNSNVTTTTPQDQLRLGRLTRLWELPSSNLLHPILDSLLSNNISTTTTTTTSLSSATRCTDRTNRGIDYCINPLVVTITSLSSGDDEDSENNLRQNGIPASDFITRHLGLQQNNSDEDDESGEDEDNSSDSEHESNEEPEETTYSDNDDEVVNKTLEENNNALIEMDKEEESGYLAIKNDLETNSGSKYDYTNPEYTKRVQMKNGNNNFHVYSSSNNNKSYEHLTIPSKRKRLKENLINFNEHQSDTQMTRSTSLKKRNTQMETIKIKLKQENVNMNKKFYLPVLLKSCITFFSSFSRYLLRSHMVTSELDTEKNKNRLIVNNAQNNIILGDNNLQSNDFHSEETNHFNQSENKPSYYYYYEDCHQKRNDTGDDCKWFYKTYEASKLMDSSKAEEYQHPDCNHFLPITSISTIQTSSSGLTINGIKSSTNISSSIPSSSIGNTIINHKLYDLNICNPNIKMRRKYTRKRRTTSIKNKTYKTSRIKKSLIH